MTIARGERRRSRRWLRILVTVVAAVAVAMIGATIAETVARRTPPDAFQSPELETVARPWRPVIGSCTSALLADVTDRARCEVRGGDGAPTDVTFTLYASEAQRERARIDTGGWFVHGPRSGGFLMAGGGHLTWEHGTHPATVEVEWDQQTGADELDVLAWWDTHAPDAPGASSSPSPPSDSGGPTARMSAPLRTFSAPWHRDIRRCAVVGGDALGLITPDLAPTVVGIADERVACELRRRSGWRRAGGFQQIQFLRWDRITAQRSHRENLEEHYGKSRDRPGAAGPGSGHFLVSNNLGQCVVYWEDEAIAVGAVVVTDCPQVGRPTPETLRRFWQRRHR